MCTVTVVPAGEGTRVMVNRDEQRGRPVAAPPSLHRVGARLAIYPVDPVSGGTWAGINEAGLVAVLLNRNDTRRARSTPPPSLSRGVIVPAILEATSLAKARDIVLALDPGLFDPFRIVIVERQRCLAGSACGETMCVVEHPLARPLVFTSSSLGDACVGQPRTRLFYRMLAATPAEPLRVQEQFHRHQWPDRPEISVCMSRADASTVSRTTLSSYDGRIGLQYAEVVA